MTTISFDMAKLPSFDAVSTSHWPAEQQVQFAKAVAGIRSAEWFQLIFRDADEFERERTACCFAFAAFAELRKRMPEIRADLESLKKDLAGIRSPS
ncbi:hypothetical protein [Ralstonia pseudosolanacearum]|uniref:hypothetical protein n=1 Tax=Ralstonia pseudosolanacearum TaxID=1310165 RepID=UPI003CF8E36F